LTIRGIRGGLAVLAVLTAVPAVVRADTGLALPPVSDDSVRGFRFGEFVLVPMVGLEGRYSQNVFREDSRESPAAAGVITVRPGFRLHNPEPTIVKLTWDGAVGYSHWFSDDAGARAQGNLSAATALRADILPRSVVGLFVADQFVREIQPRNYSSTATYDRNHNHAEAGLQIRPGGGALQIALSYGFDFDLYDEFEDGDMMAHRARLLMTWDFFPKTTLLIDGDWRYMTWAHERAGFRTDSMPLRVQAGVKGYVTKKFALLLKGGFGKGFYGTGPEYQNFIGEVSAGFKPTPFTVIDFGYARDFTDSYYANYYVGDGAHLRFGQQLWGRGNLDLNARYAYVQYAPWTPAATDGVAAVSTSDRRDHAVSATATASVSILRYLSLKAGYRLEGIFTDFQITAAGAGASPDYGGFLAHQVFGELSVLY